MSNIEEFKYCVCGCGGKIYWKRHYKYNGWAKYINGHNPHIHKLDCGCWACRARRKEPHKKDCNCMACRMIRGETKGINCPTYGYRATEETKQKMRDNHADFSKENHPQWLGGISFEPYTEEFNQELKESIRKRDDYICQNCGMVEEEHLIVCGQKLHIHHINYDKKNSNETNLITLCISCNTRANFNRTYWKEYYKKKMEIINERNKI
jgi:hypothetical protein